MFFVPVDQWMSLTSNVLSRRSDYLKKLDRAIANANLVDDNMNALLRQHTDVFGQQSAVGRAAIALEEGRRKAAIAEVKSAFNAWAGDQTRKGQDWRNSGRNAKGAVTTLYNQIVYLSRQYPSADVQAGLNHVIEQRGKSIPVLFEHCECIAHSDLVSRTKDKLRKANAAKKAATIARNTYKLSGSPRLVPVRTDVLAHHGGGGHLGGFASRIDDMVKDAFGVAPGQVDWTPAEHFFKETLTHALESIKEEIAALAPGVGLGAASATVLVNTVKLVMNGIAADEMLDLSRKLETGDSQKALQRVRDWQLRDIALRTSKVARASVNAGTHAATIASCGVGIPAQLAIGIANAIIALAEVIADLGVQYRESRALTSYLSSRNSTNPLDQNLFAAAPLAGAYYLLNTPTSHIALQLVTIGAPAWQEDVEQLARSGVMKTVIEESERLIGASRYRIVRRDGARFRERAGKTLTVKAKELVGMEPLRGTSPMDGVSSASPSPAAAA